MNRIIELARDLDKHWQRRRKPGRSVLVDARTPMNFAVMAPIYRSMQSDDRVRFYFTASESPERACDIYREAGERAQLINPLSAALMKFDACLAADFLWMKLPRGTCRIQMFHGVAGKYSNIYDRPDRSMRGWDRLLFINRRRMQNFIAAGAIDAGSPSARLVGMPKLDCLVDGSLNRDDILLSLGMDPDRPTVLYAPTWSPYSSLNTWGEEIVRGLSDAGYAVIVKLHDRSLDPEYIHSGGIDWAARLRPILRNGGGILATGSDACKYMAAADVAITDHSSVGFEYLLLNRPLIRIEMPELIANTNINLEYVSLLAQASVTTKNARQVITAVEHGFAEPEWQSEERRAVVEDMFYKPGTATARAVKELYEVIELDPSPKEYAMSAN